MTSNGLRSCCHALVAASAALVLPALSAWPSPPAAAGLGGDVTAAAEISDDSSALVLASSNNAIRLLIQTNAAASATTLPNTFTLEAHGDTVLQGSGHRAVTESGSTVIPQGLTVNGVGPDGSLPDGLPIPGQASGPGWRAIRVNPAPAYHQRLREYTRDYLVLEPDLVIVHDHVVAVEPSVLRWHLQLPAPTRIDPVWQDLHLETPRVALTLSAPGRKGELRGWTRLDTPAAGKADRTIVVLSPPNEAATTLELILVFAVRPAGRRADYAFKLLESDNAVGARIHRDGYPTLVGFQLGQPVPAPSLSGFKFSGLVGVDVFRPKARPPH